ncbi:MAG: orotate phosphoribosyltransferase [Bacteroidota bacterium]
MPTNQNQKAVFANKIAEDLLKIKAVVFRPSEPFQWSSGWKSPIYCDNRLTLSHPEIRDRIADAFVSHIREHYPDVEGIAGVATGAIALGALVADRMDLPMVYVRSKAKGHGMQKLVEGHLKEGGKYVVVEDLISTGRSSVQAVNALKEEGGVVLGTIAIFNYGFPKAEEAFAATETPFHSLTNLEALLAKAIENAYLRPDEQVNIREWQQAPEIWPA